MRSAIEPPTLAPFSPMALTQITTARELEALILTKGVGLEGNDLVRTGRLLTVAVMFGALLNPKLWSSWLRSLPGGMRESPEGLWVELDHSDLTLPARWFADPLSEAMLRRWQHDAQPAMAACSPRTSITAYLKFIEVPAAEEVAEQLERTAEVRWRLRMPALLVELAAGRIHWRSVNADSWRRIVACDLSPSPGPITGSWYPNQPRDATQARTHESACPRYPVEFALQAASDVHGRRRRWPRKAEALARCLPSVIEVERQQAGVSFVEQVLNGWVLARLSPAFGPAETRARKGVSPAWALKQIERVKPALERLKAALKEGQSLETSLIADLYRAAIRTDAKLSEQAETLWALTSLQNHLEIRRPDICVLFDEYQDPQEREESVSSHLISPAVYAIARRKFQGGNRLDWARRIYLMLGFRAGLRREEAEALLLSDFFQTGSKLGLRIRPNPHFTLKTRAARRRIPLHGLLNSDERADLRAWLQLRERETGGFSEKALLLCEANNPAVKLTRKSLDAPVVHLLRELTANPNIVYHHL